jgi:tRNA(Ile)-lysidine synthase
MARSPARPLADRVLRTIHRHGLVARGGRVAVALSGGPDSVALLHLLRELEPAGELAVVGTAHLNHGLRGADSDEDEQFCREMSAGLGLPLDVERADVRALARERKRSIEDAARLARYAFLERAAARLAADVVAVGHSRDDQAETFLLRLFRGAGPRGLAGILPRAGRVVRPLLDVARAELRAYVAERGIEYREDATNADVRIPRNRVRHELIPYLQREFSPGIVDVLARAAAIAGDDEDRLQREAIELAAALVLADKDSVRVEAGALTSLHPALAARVARIALSRLAGERFLGFDHIGAFLTLARHGARGAAMSLPGQRARLLAGGGAGESGLVIELTAETRRARRTAPKPERGEDGGPFPRVPLSIPGEVTLGSTGWTISAQPLDGLPESGAGGERRGVERARGTVVAVAASAVSLPLAVRSRRPGDRFRPLGLGGARKKLQDFLVDRKVPRGERDGLPLVVDAEDRIVWVVGQSVGEDFRVTTPSRGVILLKARRLGGEG